MSKVGGSAVQRSVLAGVSFRGLSSPAVLQPSVYSSRCTVGVPRAGHAEATRGQPAQLPETGGVSAVTGLGEQVRQGGVFEVAHHGARSSAVASHVWCCLGDTEGAECVK